MYSVYHLYLIKMSVVCPHNKLYSWGSFSPWKFLRRILFHMVVDVVGNRLNLFIFTFFLLTNE